MSKRLSLELNQGRVASLNVNPLWTSVSSDLNTYMVASVCSLSCQFIGEEQSLEMFQSMPSVELIS